MITQVKSSALSLEESTKLFCEQARKAHESRMLFSALFESEDAAANNAIKHVKVAGYFFGWLNQNMRDHALLQAAKLIDPKESRVKGKMRRNVSCEGILHRIQEVDVRDRLEALNLQAFSAHISEARNKILAHSDEEALGCGSQLGAFSDDVDDAFYEGLQDFVNILHEHVFGGPFPLREVMILNDVQHLLTILKNHAERLPP